MAMRSPLRGLLQWTEDPIPTWSTFSRRPRVSTLTELARFARLWVQAQFLVLEMDIVVGGGVTSRHLRSTIELWDRLIQEFLLHLRNRPALAAEAMKQQAPVSTGTQALAGDEGSERKSTLQ